MNEPIKLIWRQTAPYFIGTILANKIFLEISIQAGIIKRHIKILFLMSIYVVY